MYCSQEPWCKTGNSLPTHYACMVSVLLMAGLDRYMHFNYTAVGVTKIYKHSAKCKSNILQQTPLHSNWDELVTAAVPYFKPALSMERKQGRMKAMRSSHIFTPACLNVCNRPSKFPFQPLDMHIGKNKIQDARTIKGNKKEICA